MIKRLVLLVLTCIASVSFASEKLVFSVDLVRHGDRTPLFKIPKSPDNWKNGYGQLTEKGAQQETALGTKLRNLYVTQYHLLPEMYDPSTVYVRSTDFARAIDSANSLLLGLYPIQYRDAKNKIIEVHALPHHSDNILTPRFSHNVFSTSILYFWQKIAWHKKTSGIEDKLELWRQATGMQLSNFREIVQLADNLYIRQLYHVNLPPGISSEDAETIKSLAEYALINLYQFKSVSYPMGYAYLEAVNKYFQEAIAKQTKLKYVLFIAHDSTIMSVMDTMGVPLQVLPDYADRLNFSLFEDDNKYYVKISYNGAPIVAPACGSDMCELPQFYSLI